MKIKKLENGNYEVEKEFLKNLLYSDEKLKALEFGDVENWEWYDESLEDYDLMDYFDFQEIDADEYIESFVE